MSVNPELRTLDIAIPAQPESLVKLSLLMAEDDLNLAAISQLIESDMALAAAVLKAVNSSCTG
jgi:HD-like signal output (HDOD) protein